MTGIIAAAMTALVSVMIWYLKYQTKRQAEREDKHDKIQEEDRTFNRNLVTNYLEGLHRDNIKNARLNRKSVRMLSALAEYLNRHFNGIKMKVK